MDYFQSSNPDSRAEPSPMAENGKDKKKKGIRVKKLSTDPQSVAARERRHRISNRFKILQSLVPGGSKMDTATMLDEAIHYVKYLKSQIWFHKNMVNFNMDDTSSNIFDDDDDVDLSINSTTVILPSSSSVASADQVPLTLPMYSRQQQPEFFGAVQPSPPSVPCYQLGEGTMYFDM